MSGPSKVILKDNKPPQVLVGDDNPRVNKGQILESRHIISNGTIVYKAKKFLKFLDYKYPQLGLIVV